MYEDWERVRERDEFIRQKNINEDWEQVRDRNRFDKIHIENHRLTLGLGLSVVCLFGDLTFDVPKPIDC